MLKDLLRAIVADPQAEDRYLVLADWLEEHDDPRRAELLRLHRRLLTTCCEPDEHPERASWQARTVELIGHGVRPCVQDRKVKLAKGLKIAFNFIPPGTFLMGSSEFEEGRRDREVLHQVTITRAFWLGIYPVMQKQWHAVMGSHLSHFTGNARPVETVAWEDCQEFAWKLSQRAGQRFRLPTEAEWEYACRAGTTTPFFFGKTLSTEQANYNGNFTYAKGNRGIYRQQTTPKDTFPPNAWGLYDMHGNVWEWCEDRYAPYQGGFDPLYEGDRVLRGGSWDDEPQACRSACRNWCDPTSVIEGSNCHGFRVVLCPDDQGP